MPRETTFLELDQDVFRVTAAFLRGRMNERQALEWALTLKPSASGKRLAVLGLIDSPEGHQMAEPWRSAWRLIEESWKQSQVEDTLGEAYRIKRRLQSGDRSGALVQEIVQLVEPHLVLRPLSADGLYPQKVPRRPQKVSDLLTTRLFSGGLVEPNILELSKLTERDFLSSLATAVQAAVNRGLDIARRTGWDGKRHFWRLGQLHRVYYVPASERFPGDHEPDEFHQGIAPAVKLLYLVVSRLVDTELSVGMEFAHRWRATDCAIHQRLWAALSRDPRVAEPAEVSQFLLSLDGLRFWNLHEFPEIAELRAGRFRELDPVPQAALIARIRRRPPRRQWPRLSEARKVERGRLYWAARELRRIELGGATLPAADSIWLSTAMTQFPELAQMNHSGEGFLMAAQAKWVPSDPDNRFDSLAGAERLSALEEALSAQGARSGLPDKRATDWMRLTDSLTALLSDFESAPDAGSAYPHVWDLFGWSHAALWRRSNGGLETPRLAREVSRGVTLLAQLSTEAMWRAIEGLTEWFSAWASSVVTVPGHEAVWHRFWAAATESTNGQQPTTDPIDLNTVARGSADHEPMDLDTLNTPAGRLVSVFLAACPAVVPGATPFESDQALAEMRDTMMAAGGRTWVIVRHRLIEQLPYFLNLDKTWSRQHLISPLMAEGTESLVFWRALARQTLFYDVLKEIGDQMVGRLAWPAMGRETRQSLVFSLLVECLWSLQERREPAVPYPRLQQMIRSLDDEIRAYAADAIQRFVANVSASDQGKARSLSPDKLFFGSAAPLLGRVWPQERSLATPGVSRALAHLPAASKEAFAPAVSAVERFLVPFDCWSMIDYGLFGEEDGEGKLSSIDNQDKASALLLLFDRTIGTSETAVVPYDLATALDQIQRVAPVLADTPTFRRLSAAARRT